jgi:hypothetical protein
MEQHYHKLFPEYFLAKKFVVKRKAKLIMVLNNPIAVE